MLTLSEQDYK